MWGSPNVWKLELIESPVRPQTDAILFLLLKPVASHSVRKPLHYQADELAHALKAPQISMIADEGVSAWRWVAQIERTDTGRHVTTRLDQLSRRLGDSLWLDGAFSAGDLMMVSVLLRTRMSGILDEYRNLADYVVRGEARPAYARAFAAQLAVNTRTAGQPFDTDRDAADTGERAWRMTLKIG